MATLTESTKSAEEQARRENTVRLGKEIYQASLRAIYEPAHIGEYLIIDVDTGEHRLIERYEDVAPTIHALEPGHSRYLMKIGYEAMYRMGGGRLKRISYAH